MAAKSEQRSFEGECDGSQIISPGLSTERETSSEGRVIFAGIIIVSPERIAAPNRRIQPASNGRVRFLWVPSADD